MTTSQSITTAFLEALRPDLRSAFEEFGDLDLELARLIADAAARAPEIAPIELAAELAARIASDAPPAHVLATTRAGDLALALACARGELAALSRFEAELFGEVDAAAARFRNASITRDELRQAIRDRLFTPQADGPPRIASYQGRGDLRSWVRMATTRYLVDVVRADGARPDRVSADDQLENAAAAADDPELAFLKHKYRAEFRAAFGAALAALEPRDRNILRHRYLEGLEIAELAAIYGQHRVTMSRTLTRIREQLLDGLRREFVHRLGLEHRELDEVVALIQSQLELSLSRLLAP